MIQLKAMRLVEPGKPLELCDVSMPTTSEKSALVKVETSGVCHTDLHLISGYYDLGNGKRIAMKDRGIKLPLTLGHEIAGRVATLGRDATSSVNVGDSVVVYPWLGCGTCRKCLAQRENLCEGKPDSIGIFRDGGYAEYVLVPNVRYLVRTNGLDSSQSAPLACSGLTALSAVKKCRLSPNDLLIIVGAGGLGSTALQIAKKITRARVAVLDIDETKLELSTKLGADYAINTSTKEKDDVVSRIRTFNSGLGADAVIDFVGNPLTSSMGFQLLGREGRLVLVGLFGGAVELPLPLFPLRGAEVIGNFTGTMQDLVEVVDLAKRRVVSPVVSATFKLEDVNLALAKLERGEIRGRAVVRLD